MSVFRLTSAAMALVFVVFAAVQYNDPDAVLWALVYCLPAVVSVAAVFRRIPRGVVLVAVAFAAGFLWLSPEFFQREWIDSEEGRESAGLLIAALWLGAVAAVGRGRGARAAR